MTGPTVVRAYRDGDDDALYDICLRTGDSGGDASGQFADPRLLGEIYVGPYLRFEPELAFVADDGDVAGYVLGARDTRQFEATCEQLWWPQLRRRYPEGTYPEGSRDARLLGLVHRPPVADADVVATYPSHLHIDLLPRTQGRGMGRALMERLLEALAATGSPGVHLGVGIGNERAVGFYRRLGFTVERELPSALIMARTVP
ncbi:acetyltransferase (GNAT) family protein [Haloactinopolyspora alba]|uniref:Acetyltransferase (GNAT) family protein n=1 Tax=Haloactinopolyspora alba TaxID=648780 RepID=A0A2P8DZ11_9ACTN|nr:GNAT family N-acetyltransferase [Haloactinopolyspora alba]PSL02417.1 acetyltransferase (GNAT) family protein [Haloactinopolyspora alba]